MDFREFLFRDCLKSLVVGQARTLQVQKRDENNLILVLCASQLCDQDATQHLFGQSQRDCLKILGRLQIEAP